MSAMTLTASALRCAGRLAALFASFCAAQGSLATAGVLAQEAGDAVEGEEQAAFDESLRRFGPVQVEAGVQDYRIEVEVHRWGKPELDFTAEITIPGQPAFLENVRVVEGSSVLIEAGEWSRTVSIRFDTSPTRGASSEGGPVVDGTAPLLRISIAAQDDDVVPPSRLFEIPFVLRSKETAAIQAHALAEDAPEDIPPRDAIDHVDAGLSEVLVYDRLALFFTPARDLGEPLETKSFAYRVRRLTDGREQARGWIAFRGVGDPSLIDPLPFAKEGSPARFAVVLDPWKWDGEESGTIPFMVETTDAMVVGDGLLGGGGSDGWSLDAEKWQEEGTFELGSRRLQYLGFVFERLENGGFQQPTDGRDWPGRADVTEEKSGARVDLELRIRNGDLDGSSRLSLHFPEELDPAAPTMGTVRVEGTAPPDPAAARAAFGGIQQSALIFTAAMRPLLPLGELPEHPEELWGSEPPVPWGELRPGGLISMWTEKVRDRTMIHDGFGWLDGEGRPDAFERTVELAFHPPPRGHTPPPDGEHGAAGEPARSLARHLRAQETRWVLPVVVQLANSRLDRNYDPPGTNLSMHGYAIYGAGSGSEGGSIAHARTGTGGASGAASPAADEPPGPTEAERAEAELAEAVADLEQAEAAAERAKELAEQGAVSRAEADAAEAARREAEARVETARGGAQPSVPAPVEPPAAAASEPEPEASPPAGSEPTEQVSPRWSVAQRLGPPIGTEYFSGKSSVHVDADTNTVRIVVSDWEYVGTWTDPPEEVEPGEMLELALELRAVKVGKVERDTFLRVGSGGGVSWIKDQGKCRPTPEAPHVRTTAKILAPDRDGYHELRIEVSARPWSGWTFPLATYVYDRADATHRDATWIPPSKLRIPHPNQIGPHKRATPVPTIGMSTGGWPGAGGFRTLTLPYKSDGTIALEFVLEWWQEGDGGGPDLCGPPWSELGPEKAEARSTTKQARVRVERETTDDDLDWEDLRPFAEDLLRMIERAAIPCR